VDFQYFGGNCITITTKKATVAIDDTVAAIGGKSPAKDGDILLFTQQYDGSVQIQPKLLIDNPGEYEVSGISIHGVPARLHIDEADMNAIMYRIIVDDVRIGVLGNVHPDLSEEQLEQLGTIDILFVPVGGNGYTLDPIGAQKVVKKIEPKIIIPTHYADKSLKYEVPQQPLEEAVKVFAMEPAETTPKLKLKSSDVTEGTKLVILRQEIMRYAIGFDYGGVIKNRFGFYSYCSLSVLAV
jgi:hypothetical protein